MPKPIDVAQAFVPENITLFDGWITDEEVEDLAVHVKAVVDEMFTSAMSSNNLREPIQDLVGLAFVAGRAHANSEHEGEQTITIEMPIEELRAYHAFLRDR